MSVTEAVERLAVERASSAAIEAGGALGGDGLAAHGRHAQGGHGDHLARRDPARRGVNDRATRLKSGSVPRSRCSTQRAYCPCRRRRAEGSWTSSSPEWPRHQDAPPAPGPPPGEVRSATSQRPVPPAHVPAPQPGAGATPPAAHASAGTGAPCAGAISTVSPEASRPARHPLPTSPDPVAPAAHGRNTAGTCRTRSVRRARLRRLRTHRLRGRRLAPPPPAPTHQPVPGSGPRRPRR